MISAKTTKRLASEFKDIFEDINEACKKSGESVVALSDTNYYAQQIHNMEDDRSFSDCVAIAEEMAKL